MADRRLELLQQLRAVTELQLDAAKKLDGARLDKLNAERTDLIFELQLASQDPLPEDTAMRQALATEAKALRQLEERLAKVAGTVVETLDHLVPRPDANAKRYSRSGRLS
jgi:hypothetical protein